MNLARDRAIGGRGESPVEVRGCGRSRDGEDHRCEPRVAVGTRELERWRDAERLRPPKEADKRTREERNGEKPPAVDHIVVMRSFLHQRYPGGQQGHREQTGQCRHGVCLGGRVHEVCASCAKPCSRSAMRSSESSSPTCRRSSGPPGFQRVAVRTLAGSARIARLSKPPQLEPMPNNSSASISAATALALTGLRITPNSDAAPLKSRFHNA